jgi:hypothetical protein
MRTFICFPWAYSSSLKQLYLHYLDYILGLWVTCGVKMISLRHDWGWQPPQTVTYIHIRLIQSAWGHSYAVHGRTAVASNSYTHNIWVMFLGSKSLVELKGAIMQWYKLTATQISSCVNIGHRDCAWGHSYAVHSHTAVASISSTHTIWLRFWGSKSLVE